MPWFGRDEIAALSVSSRDLVKVLRARYGYELVAGGKHHCQSSGCVLFGGDLSCVLAACGLRNCVETRNNPGSEPGLLPGRNEALYWSPWDPSPVSATSCSTSESP